MTTNQIRTRNWQKARLIGFSLNVDVLSERERELYFAASEKLMQIQDGWDDQTELLIGHSLPPYKCCWCGKRSNIEHILDGKNFCSKHYKEIRNEERLEGV